MPTMWGPEDNLIVDCREVLFRTADLVPIAALFRVVELFVHIWILHLHNFDLFPLNQGVGKLQERVDTQGDAARDFSHAAFCYELPQGWQRPSIEYVVT